MQKICTSKRAIETVYRIYGKDTIEKQFGKGVCPSPGSITDHMDRWKRDVKELYLDKKDFKRCKKWLRDKESPLNYYISEGTSGVQKLYNCFTVHIKDPRLTLIFRLTFDTREVYHTRTNWYQKAAQKGLNPIQVGNWKA